MQKLFGINLWVCLLCMTVVLGAMPVSTVYGMENEKTDMFFAENVTDETTNIDQSPEEKSLGEIDLKQISDEELSEYVKSADITECAEWLSEMTEAEFNAVIARDSWLCEETTVVNYAESEYDEENGYELSYTGETTVPYYRYVLNSCGLTAPGEWTSQKAHYFDTTSGYYYMKYYSSGVLMATSTVKVSGLSTSTALGTAQKPTVSIATTGKITGGAVSFTNPVNGSGKVTLKAPNDWGETSSNGDQNVILKLQFRLNSEIGYGIAVQKDYYQGKHFDLKLGSYDASYKAKTDYTGNTSYESATADSITSYVDLAYNSTVGKQGSSGATMTSGQASVFQFHFSPALYSVVYDGNGATGGATLEQNCSYGSTYSFRENGFIRNYYVSYHGLEGKADREIDIVSSIFKGWNTAQNAVEALYQEAQSFTNLTAKNAKQIKLYAIWQPGVIVLPSARRDGYRFVGWNNGLKAGECFAPTTDVTLSAEYEPICYTVEYYDGVNRGKIYSQEMFYDEESLLMTVEELKLERPGYRFLGWQFGEQVYKGGERVCNLTKEDGAVLVLNAVWEKIKSEVTDTDSNDDAVTGKDVNYFINSYGLSESQVAAFIEAMQNGKRADITINEVQYTIRHHEDGTYSIQLAKLLSGQSKVEVPSVIKVGNQVFSITKITDNAFKNNADLKEVSIAKGITIIGKYAFYHCKNLKKITMPDTVMKIGKYAFANCKKLKSVKMSTSCYEMGEGVFSNCEALTKISLKGKMTEIPKKAFFNCSSLKKVTLGSKTAEIKKQAFMGCKKLSSVTIPAKVQEIGTKSFYGCTSLKKVTIKSKVLTSVGNLAFGKCRKLVKIVVPNDKLEAYTKLLKK